MKILIFDTETTGLPERNAAILSTHKWPYIVQLSYLIYDTDEHMVLDYIDRIIKLPPGISISKESEDIHKISDEISKSKGVDIKHELIEFNKQILNVDLIIAHNISFDKNIIMVECVRHKINYNFTKNNKRIPEYCTMKNSINLCKIVRHYKNGEQYYKFPKLMELHQHLFNSVPEGLHNSMIDVLACLRCYGKMKLDVDLEECSPSFNSIRVIKGQMPLILNT